MVIFSLRKFFVPDEDRLPGVNSFQDTTKEVLSVSRVIVAWQPIGISMGVFDICHRYLKERKQFGAPLAAFQINQEKLVCMLGNIQAMLLVGWRLCKLYESGKMTPGHASLGKAWNSLKARETVSLGRELLGGNGILADYLVAKIPRLYNVYKEMGIVTSFQNILDNIFLPLFEVTVDPESHPQLHVFLKQAFCDAEPVFSYEGTYDINSLVTGREITGIASFKPAVLGKASRL